MKEYFGLRWIIVCGLIAACAIAMASDRTEPNAFLDTNANTVPQLIQEVRTDKRVCDRYARHFGKTKEELVSYFGTLHLAKLNADGVYQIFSVDNDGIIKAHPQRLKAGTRVFADASGQPVLKASCGNAMVPGTNVLTTTISPSVSQPAGVYHEMPLTTPVSEESQMMQGVEVTPESPIALAPAMPPTELPSGERNQGMSVLPLLAAFGGAGGIFLSGHGGSAPVPEPMPILVMASALVGLKLRRRTK